MIVFVSISLYNPKRGSPKGAPYAVAFYNHLKHRNRTTISLVNGVPVHVLKKPNDRVLPWHRSLIVTTGLTTLDPNRQTRYNRVT